MIHKNREGITSQEVKAFPKNAKFQNRMLRIRAKPLESKIITFPQCIILQSGGYF